MRKYINDFGLQYTHDEPPSSRQSPLRLVRKRGQAMDYSNEDYDVTVRHYPSGFFLKNSRYALIAITARDQTARHDWRDFQQIKNMAVGRDWEAIELYPAESRLKDPSNQFYLWAVPKGILKFGLPGGRRVYDEDEALAPQRPFPKEETDDQNAS